MEANSKVSNEKEKPFQQNFSFWIGVIGSMVTITLTIWNTHTKSLIDKKEEDLKILEIKIKDRVTNVEESKERVERYKWVLSLFPSLNSRNIKEKNFSLNLMRLALTKKEAEQLFTGFQNSTDTSLQSLGENGIAVIQNEPIAFLVAQMNAENAETRKSAVSTLIHEYKSSTQAISLTLRTYDSEKFNVLSSSAIINGVVFLKATDPAVWNTQQVLDAKKIINKIRNNNPGPQTSSVLTNFENFINTVRPNN